MFTTEFDIFDDAPMGELFDTDPRRLGITSAASRSEARKERQALKARAARAANPNCGWRDLVAVQILEGTLPPESMGNLEVEFRLTRPSDTRPKAEDEQV
jgi:hypothetical protein